MSIQAHSEPSTSIFPPLPAENGGKTEGQPGYARRQTFRFKMKAEDFLLVFPNNTGAEWPLVFYKLGAGLPKMTSGQGNSNINLMVKTGELAAGEEILVIVMA